MGSFSRRAAGVVGAVLAGAGLAAAPSAAQAKPEPQAQPQTIIAQCTNGVGDTESLKTAIETANTLTSARIRLGRNCHYDLTVPYNQMPAATRGPNGLPIITGDIAIDGRGSTIRRTGAGSFRILEVASGAVLRAVGLGISGGDAGVNTGGGILNARGRVLLAASTVSGNRADNGGGISNDSGDLRLVLSNVSGNVATGGGGGGIYSDGFLLFDRSRLIANQANTHGGGLFSELGGRVVLSRSDLTGNRAVTGTGGALHNANGGIVQGSRMRVEFNSATDGGAVFRGGRPGSVLFSRSVFRNNNTNNCAPLNTIQGCRS
jgi:predicted outer membrane repeat protein